MSAIPFGCFDNGRWKVAPDIDHRSESRDGLLERLFALDGQVAIVTGASSGLGRRFTRVLHDAGATVVAAARRSDALAELADELGDRCVPVAADITSSADIERLTAAAFDLGKIDILVNNAGYATAMPAEDEPIEHFRRTVDVNLVGLFELSQRVGRHMLDARSGNIINIASILGLVASTPVKQASYCASKAGVVNLTRELAAQWARKGIRVNAIAPGWFPSEMTQEEMFDDPSGQSFIATHCPMGRGGEPDELDAALLFLAGAGSSYVTGHTIAVDGGWVAR